MKWKSSLLSLLVVAAMAAPPSAMARTVGPQGRVEAFGMDEFWDYALCGASIALAAGTGGWVLAFIACGKAATAHWTE